MRRNQIIANSKPEKTTKVWEWTECYNHVKENGLTKVDNIGLRHIHRNLCNYLHGAVSLNAPTRVKFRELQKLLEEELARRSQP